LGPHIAKLAHDAQKQIILFPKWSGIEIRDFVLHEAHVGVGDFGHGGEEEEDGEEDDEAGDAEVDPLDGAEGGGGIADILEEDVGGKERGGEGADALDSLAEVEADFGVAGGTAD